MSKVQKIEKTQKCKCVNVHMQKLLKILKITKDYINSKKHILIIINLIIGE